MENLDFLENNQDFDEDIFNQLKKSIFLYDKNLARKLLDKIIESKINPNKALDVMTDAIKQIGEEFENGNLFLPDLIAAADTMLFVLPFLEKEITTIGIEKRIIGKVVIGTVSGDLHSIGKTMVSTFLTAAGFKVFDLGIDVPASDFIDAAKQFNADILAMSALLTTTVYEQRNVIKLIEKEGLRKRIKIIVGGGPVTEEFAKEIGSDGYESNAPGAAKLAKRLLGL